MNTHRRMHARYTCTYRVPHVHTPRIVAVVMHNSQTQHNTHNTTHTTYKHQHTHSQLQTHRYKHAQAFHYKRKQRTRIGATSLTYGFTGNPSRSTKRGWAVIARSGAIARSSDAKPIRAKHPAGNTSPSPPAEKLHMESDERHQKPTPSRNPKG